MHQVNKPIFPFSFLSKTQNFPGIKLIFICLFCSFLTLYNRDDIDVIGLDDAASKLGFYYFFIRPWFW
jgi:transcription factor E2F7/8